MGNYSYVNPYAISKARLMDDLRPFDRTCTYCGKAIQVPYKWKDRVSVFCSQKCRNAHLKKKREERFKPKENE